MRTRKIILALVLVILSGCFAFATRQEKPEPFVEKEIKDGQAQFDRSLRFVIVKESDLDALQLRVNLMMKEGYYPVGGVTIEASPGTRRYLTAMVLEDIP